MILKIHNMSVIQIFSSPHGRRKKGRGRGKGERENPQSPSPFPLPPYPLPLPLTPTLSTPATQAKSFPA